MPKEDLERDKNLVKARSKTRKSAAERRALLEEAERKAKEQREQALLQFNLARPQKWLELWAKALELELLAQGFPGVKEYNSWWFEDFNVNVKARTFSTSAMGHEPVTQECLNPTRFDMLNDELDQAFAWIEEFQVERERKRLEALLLAQQREAALAKLTEEDKKALGIR